MPPRYLRRASATRLKPCQERTFEACDTAPTDQCCGVIPCKLCLEWETYADGISYGSADFDTSAWTGTVGGGAFVAYWERNGYDECEFVVTFDGEEVYRSDCYGGASCRNPSGEVAASIGYDEGTLRWSVYEPRELALIDDPDTGCRDFFCGSCRCSCDCLCVTITDGYDSTITTGEICDTSYACDPPVWSGTVGDRALSIALGRDQYTGECIITLTADGEDQDAVSVTGCADMAATVTLSDGTTISVACKQCDCEPIGPCGDGCCVPFYTTAQYPNGVLENIPFSIEADCFTQTGTQEFIPLDPQISPRGICGHCATYIGNFIGSIPGKFATGIEDFANPGNCFMSPCSLPVCLILECNDDESNVVGQNACCSKMRLWVGTGSEQVGDIGERPGVSTGTGVAQCNSWKKIAPTMCECDSVGGIIASFTVSISLVCDVMFTSGVCYGLTTCCQVACSFDVVI